MAQLLLRNLDEALVARVKQRAAVSGRSMEAEGRDALARGLRLTPEEKVGLLRRLLAESAALIVPGVPQTPGWQLVQESRDER